MNENVILKIKVGSHLYGINIENSDEDYMGIFMPSEETVFGFERKDEVNAGVISKLENGKNDSNAIDYKIYDFRKYLKLAMENNPNILETLFVGGNNILEIFPIGVEILNIKHLFPHKGLKQKFLGYAFSQKHKMQIKSENFFALEEGLKILYDLIGSDTVKDLSDKEIIRQSNKFLLEYELDLTKFDNPFNFNNSFIKVGDLNLQRNISLREAVKLIERRIGEQGNRKELILNKGYDYKFGSHLVRLMLEGKELLETGYLEFPLKNHDLLLDVKQGKWTLDQVLAYSDTLEKEIESLAISSKLPVKPRYKEIQDFCIKTLKNYF